MCTNLVYKDSLFKKAMKSRPDFLKKWDDKIIPDDVRKEIIKSGGKDTLYNPNSEEEQAVNEQKEADRQEAIRRAFAEKYNNQVKML